MIIPHIWENKKCSKPPTSISSFFGARSTQTYSACRFPDLLGYETIQLLGYARKETSRNPKRFAGEISLVDLVVKELFNLL